MFWDCCKQAPRIRVILHILMRGADFGVFALLLCGAQYLTSWFCFSQPAQFPNTQTSENSDLHLCLSLNFVPKLQLLGGCLLDRAADSFDRGDI